jgi:hypothetical protein
MIKTRITVPSDPAWLARLAARIDLDVFGRTFGPESQRVSTSPSLMQVPKAAATAVSPPPQPPTARRKTTDMQAKFTSAKGGSRSP